MAREAPEDPYAGLAPDDRLLRGDAPDLEADDGADPSPVALKERALAIEECARAVPGVTNSEGAGVSAGRSVVALATSQGFARGYTTSGYGAGASVIAGAGGDMQRDSASHNVRHYADLDAPEAIGRLAGERAVKRLDPARLASGTMPVLFDPRVGGSLIGRLLGAMSGPAIARKTSFLLGREEEQLFDPAIVIVDDPHRPPRPALQAVRRRGRGDRAAPAGRGRPADRLAAQQRLGAAIGAGDDRPCQSRHRRRARRRRDQRPSASRARSRPPQLMADIKRGLYVTEMIGQGVNPVTGDYSRGASGFIIANGELAAPVAEITIAGNLIDMFRALDARQRSGASPRGQRSDPADRRDDGRRCLRTVARIAAEAGRIAAAPLRHRLPELGEGAGPAGLRRRSRGRRLPARAARRARPRSGLAVRGDARRFATGSSGRACGWSIRSTAPATICATGPAGASRSPWSRTGCRCSACSRRRSRGELWTAARGQGQPAQRRAAAGQPARRARRRAGARRTSCPRSTATWSRSPKPNSIALRIALVAAGEADLVATLRWGFEWDIAAAALIAEEAGATVSGALGQPLAFNTASGEAFGVLVATPGIHAAAVERLRERAMAVV